MRLADFIRHNTHAIVDQWESFAASLPPGADMESLALRDHAEEILQAIATDLDSYQSREAQLTKSLGGKPTVAGAPHAVAAQTHAILRSKGGFNINQLAAEYRALRASVLRLWNDAHPVDDASKLDQVMRFNEAIDEALAESIGFFHLQIEQARNLLLGMLGHDLRSPLHSILMTASFLSELNAGAEVSTAAARLINSGSRMHALLDDLRDFNRTMLGIGLRMRPVPIDLAAVFTDELNLLRAAHPTRRLDLTVTGHVHGVWDGMRLRQVLNNLVENALRYGHDGPVHIAITGEENQLRFEVSNRGPVIEASALNSIFDPLRRRVAQETSDNASGGLGLGLYIARQIAEAHGGHIEVRSDQTRTVFAVRLPRQLTLSAETPAAPAHTEHVA
jgi:signal transduction histidine kinase